jgi:hypothetical protein
MTGLAFIPEAYEATSLTLYRLRYVAMSPRLLERKRALAPVLTGIGTAYMNSGSVSEDARRAWERTRVAAVAASGAQVLIDEADRGIAFLWLTQLKRLETLALTRPNALPNESDGSDLAALVARPVFRESEGGFSWKRLRDERQSSAWRWWDDLHRQAVSWAAHVGDEEAWTYLRLWPQGEPTTDAAVIEARRDTERMLIAYAHAPLGVTPKLPEGSTLFGKELRTLILQIEGDPIWRSNLKYYRDHVRGS